MVLTYTHLAAVNLLDYANGIRLPERIDDLSRKLAGRGQLAAIPACETNPCSDPERPIPGSEQIQDSAVWE